MTKPSVLYYSCLHYTEENRDLLQSLFQVRTLRNPRCDEDLSDVISRDVECVFLPYGFKFSAQQLGKFPKLRVIASNTTTAPEVDTPLAIPIVYLNDPKFLETITSTAEHTLGLILAAHRRIPAAHKSTRDKWNRYDWGAPKMLSRSNLTIWGPGRVGTHLFDLTTPMFRTVWTIAENDNEAYILNLLRETDVLAITTSVVGPQPIVRQEHLERLPRSAIVVNTARGEVLDQGALLHLLATGRLRAAGLDVLEKDHRFLYQGYSWLAKEVIRYAFEHDNLILTPHIAGSTEDAWNETQRYVIDRVTEILL